MKKEKFIKQFRDIAMSMSASNNLYRLIEEMQEQMENLDWSSELACKYLGKKLGVDLSSDRAFAMIEDFVYDADWETDYETKAAKLYDNLLADDVLASEEFTSLLDRINLNT